MESIEGAYITISRWAMSHWSDLSWFPLWFGGSPFRNVYQPGLHLSVAALASVAHLTPQHAYHVLTALAYCGGAVTLFFLCYGLTKRWTFALASALIYSLISPVCLLSSAVRADVDGWTSPRRYQILIHYGEGPHTTALALIPVAILALHGAVKLRRRVWIAIAPLAIAAVVLTNWPGTIGLSMAVLAYSISSLGAWRLTDWLLLTGIGLTAYLIACPWMPPSTLLSVVTNAQESDATSLGAAQILAAVAAIGLLWLLNLVLARIGCDQVFRFFTFFAVIAGTVSIGYLWFGWRLLPQPHRFQLEFDLACAAVLGWLLVRLISSIPRPWAAALVAVLLIAGIAQARTYRRYARRQTRPIDITSTIEFQMASWFEKNLPGQRVFAPGNVSLWMNMFNDEPQMAGCCDQSVPSNQYRLATYAVYAGHNNQDAQNARLWLQAYGVSAVGTTGPDSTEVFKPFVNWHEFDGVLPELWRGGGSAIYRVPRKSADPVRVIPKSALATRAPAGTLDIAPIQPLVAALEDLVAPASDFRWISTHEALLHASTRPGDVVFLQVSWSPGWRAIDNGESVLINRDPLGMMYIEPASSGPHEVHLRYEEGTEARIAGALRLLGLGLVAAAAITGLPRSQSLTLLEPREP